MSLTRFERLILGAFGVVFLALGGLGAFMARELSTPLPTPIVLATLPPSETFTTTPSPSATATRTSTPSPSLTPTPSPTMTVAASPTATATSTLTPSPTPTATDIPDPIWSYADFGPYLQSVTTDSVIIAWQTSKRRTGSVEFGETPDYGHVLEEKQARKRHHLMLTGLSPYTVYHYRVFNDGQAVHSDMTFRTAAAAEHDSFNFVVYGDTQHHPQIQSAVAVRAVSHDPDFFLHMGDLVNDGESAEDWHAFFDLAAPLLARSPVYPTLGNHERRCEFYFDLFYLPGDERWYTFTYGEARFISLRVDEETGFEKGTAQHDWLKGTLQGNTQPWVVVFFHRSPYTSEYEGQEEIAIREALTPLFETHGVDLVLSGHNHNYQRSEAGGITYVVSGGGGGELSSSIEPDEYLVAHEVAHHYLFVQIEGQTLEAQALDLDGKTIDRFTIGPP
jgi:hypothetical protein